MKNLYLFSLLFLLFCKNSYSQGENNHWYFGNVAGVQFANGAATITPTVLTNSNGFFRTTDIGTTSISGGCASVSKADGSLLFYTDGRYIYDKTHSIMSGTPTGACNQYLYTYDFEGTRQAAIIFPNPGNINQYYVLSAAPPISLGSTCSITNGYFYTLIDFSVNLNGQITSFRQPFTTFIEGSQAITVTSNQNGDGFWVLIPVGKVTAHNLNQFIAYKVDNTGLNFTPTVITTLNYDFGFNSEVKVSQDVLVDKIAIAAGENSSYTPKTRVYGFDRQTGLISSVPLLSIDGINVNSTEFSADGNLLFATIYSNNGYQLVVYDINNPLTPFRVLSTTAVRGSLQRAIDGNIYFTNLNNNTFLFKINNQNSFSGSSISSSSINLGRYALFGLPQLVPALGSTNDCLITPTLTLSSPGNDMNNSTMPNSQILRERSDWIKATNVIGFGNSNFQNGVVYHAGNYIELNPGFEAISSSQFSAYIEGCSGNFVYKNGNIDNVENTNDLELIKNRISLYPNPTNTFLNITYNSDKFVNITINSIDGRLIFKRRIDQVNTYQLDVSTFKDGMYVLSIETLSGNLITEKLIKK